MTGSHWFARQSGAILTLGLLIALICLAPPPAPAQSSTNMQNGGTTITHSGAHKMPSAMADDSSATQNDGTLSARQKQFIVHANFEKSKNDATELAALAKGLREELDKPNANALSLEVANRIEKIQKLAKKIRDETKGF